MPVASTATEVFIAAAVPNTSAAQPSLMDGNNNLANTPPAPGAITVPQSPAGTSVTNTTRTRGATAAFLAVFANAQNVGTTPPPTGNLHT